MKNMKKIYNLIGLILLIFVIGGIAGVIGERFMMPWLSTFPSLERCSFFQKANEKVTVINQTKEIIVKEDFSVANIAEKVSPSVVSIVSFKKRVEEELKNVNQIKTSQDIQKNIKTGLILTSDGLIVSVLDDAIREIIKEDSNLKVGEESVWNFKILAGDSNEYDAKILSVDEFNNLVFYKVDKTDLSIPSLGDSANIEVGEKVVICGNAGGEYQNSFSSGLIKERDYTFTLLNSELSFSEKLEGAILLDAKIEDRNIGGPVLDYNGSVVGIVNQIEKDGQKVGFVIPINDLKPTINKVLEKKEINNPSLGVYYLSINREIALLNNLNINRGALVYSFSGQQGLAVIKDSAADKAGIKIGDIIIAVDGKAVDLQNPLSKLIIEHQPGDEIEIKLVRNEERINLKVILE